MPDEVEIKIPAPDGTEKKYTMTYSLWIDDIADQKSSRTATGEIDDQAFWIKRLQRNVKGLTEEQIRKMQRWEVNGLINRWLQMNEVDPARFLEMPPKATVQS